MDLDPDNEEMEDVNLYEKMERHWSMVFEDNNGGADNKKVILHAKMWDIYMNEKQTHMNSTYSMYVVGYDGKKVLWEVEYDHIVEKRKYHDEIGLWLFDFNLFDKNGKGDIGEGFREYPYLLILMKL